mgnify:CR=1 FL=1
MTLEATGPNTLPGPPEGRQPVGFTVEFTGAIVPGAEADIEFKDGQFSVAGTDKSVPWFQMALAAYTAHNLPSGMEPGLKQKPTKGEIKNEANNGLKNDKYTLAMARTNAPHSATAQFFINTANNDFLNFRSESAQGWGYAVFGRVVDGTAIVDQIEKVRTGSRGFHDDVPVEDVVITRAVIVE